MANCLCGFYGASVSLFVSVSEWMVVINGPHTEHNFQRCWCIVICWHQIMVKGVIRLGPWFRIGTMRGGGSAKSHSYKGSWVLLTDGTHAEYSRTFANSLLHTIFIRNFLLGSDPRPFKVLRSSTIKNNWFWIFWVWAWVCLSQYQSEFVRLWMSCPASHRA